MKLPALKRYRAALWKTASPQENLHSLRNPQEQAAEGQNRISTELHRVTRDKLNLTEEHWAGETRIRTWWRQQEASAEVLPNVWAQTQACLTPRI